MRAVVTTGAAVRSARATRRDLLLEALALRHQILVLARSNRRFRPTGCCGCLWGAPRIHGELLKLGITISERTVSRYLRGRPTTRSQTWRTFLANHFGGQTLISPVMVADAEDEDSIVDASDVSWRPAPSIDGSCASIHGPTAASWRSRRLSSLGVSLGQHHLQDRAGARKSSGRDPPRHLPSQPASRHVAPAFFVRDDCAFVTDGSVRSIWPRVLGHLQF
jgi:hypothetical protein